MSAPDTVFFLSDYGLRDEFVGLVHAAIRRDAPHVTVIDLTHEVPAFDVRVGAWTLARAFPHLGPGVVLSVVDPGVGGDRRGVAIELREASGPRWLIGPDNGLLMSAADTQGTVERAVELRTPVGSPVARGTERWSGSVSFDGRDLFAPAAAALCNGISAVDLGPAVDLTTLVRLPDALDERALTDDGAHHLRAEVVALDRFGNVKLSSVVDGRLAEDLPLGRSVEVRLTPRSVHAANAAQPSHSVFTVETVRTFSDLASGDLGLMADADRHLALVARTRSAAQMVGAAVGDVVELRW